VCRNIKRLYNFDPPATDDEIREAALQFVRKLSGYNKPSQRNQLAFDAAVEEIAKASSRLLQTLTTQTKPRNREQEALKQKQRSAQRFS